MKRKQKLIWQLQVDMNERFESASLDGPAQPIFPMGFARSNAASGWEILPFQTIPERSGSDIGSIGVFKPLSRGGLLGPISFISTFNVSNLLTFLILSLRLEYFSFLSRSPQQPSAEALAGGSFRDCLNERTFA